MKYAVALFIFTMLSVAVDTGSQALKSQKVVIDGVVIPDGKAKRRIKRKS